MPCCSKIPETVDGDLEEKGQYVSSMVKGFKVFEINIAETLNAYQVLLTSFEKVSHSFVELSAGSTQNIQVFAHNFEDGMRKLRDGPAISSLHTDVTRYVKEGLPPLKTEREKVYKMYKSLKKLKESQDKCRHKMSVTEKEYAKKSRALSESKSYSKLGKKRDELGLKYAERRQEFDAAVEQFKENVERFLSASIPGYAACSTAFTKHLGQQLKVYASAKALREGTKGRVSIQSTASASEKINNESVKNENPLTLEEQYYTEEKPSA